MTSFFHKKIFFCRLLSCRHCKSATILHCDLTRKVTKQKSQKRLSMSQKWCNISEQNTNGVMAQLVARLNGIQKVRGSNPLGSTTFYQSAPLADWFFIFLDFFVQNVNDFIVLQRKGTNFHILKLCNPNLSAHKSFLCLSQSHRVLLPFGVAV